MTSYFAKNYSNLSFPVESGDEPGFRSAQLAALGALTAHFFSKLSPAIVVMPTGSGKSAIITAAPFLLRCNRVLVITPSRLVREQLGENFASLVDLHKLNALAKSTSAPSVGVVDEAIKDITQWEAMRQFDVVIATVASLVPRTNASIRPPHDLFDLLLIDEAHHSPARTWQALLESIPDARKILFTATPFRRDEQRIVGDIVFRYELKRARDDGVFGDIRYEAVATVAGEPIDTSIARAVERRYRIDQQAGLDHRIMVRADTVTRAKELEGVYADHTSLRLELVQGQHTLKHVRKVLGRLENRDLDGIVCVNMFGEGFNLPKLKIAGIHSPHRSLAITLQFIGRFARRVPGVGEACFLAEPHESTAELAALYEEGSTWRDLIANLSDSRVDEEVTNREVIEGFETRIALPDLSDFSLYTIRPYCHAKVFRASAVDIAHGPGFPASLEVVFFGLSAGKNAAIYITRELQYPTWAVDDRFCNIAYDVFVFYHNRQHQLLFVCATRRQSALYEALITPMTNGSFTALAGGAVNRVLHDLDNLSVFSLGLRVRNPLGRTESYQQRTGGSVDRTVQEADARRFDQGHIFAKAQEGSQSVTIGVSATSKVWSNAYLPLPKLLIVFDKYAGRISNTTPVVTNTKLDLVSAGDEVSSVPAGIYLAIWSHETYDEQPIVVYANEDGEVLKGQLLDFDLKIVSSREGTCQFEVGNGEVSWNGRYTIGSGQFIACASDDEPYVAIQTDGGEIELAQYLNEALPSFYCEDLSRLEGSSRYPDRSSLALFSLENIHPVDWSSKGIDPTSEKISTTNGQSLFQWVEHRAIDDGDRFVFCDDSSGEIADFVTANLDVANPVVRFYHCKSSDNPPGARVNDLYEVLGQAMRTSPWFNLRSLERQIRHRISKTSVRGFICGSISDLAWLREPGLGSKVKFEVYVVQPGLARDRVTPRILELLGGVGNHLHGGGCERFEIFGSVAGP